MTDSYLDNGQGPDDHVASCPDCSAVVALIERRGEEVAPPLRLREAVMSRARRRRVPAETAVAAVAVPYAQQVALMDELLAELSEPQWDTPVARHGTVRGMVEHLSANDATVASFLGVRGIRDAQDARDTRGPGGTHAHRRWRDQAGAVLERVSAGTGVLLGVEVELAGTRRARGPLRQAMVQRTFETWTHADDIRSLTGRPRAVPAPEHVRMIAEFGLAMLPRVVKGPRRDVAATVVLTGPGGGTWTVPLSPAPERVAVLLSADAVGFCRLLAGRWPPGSFPYAAEGDPLIARDLVRAAATLGCD